MSSSEGPDLTEFKKLTRPKKPFCTLGLVLEQLDTEERGQLVAALDQPRETISGRAIVDWCARRGYITSHSAVTSHRARTCTCYD